MGHLVYDLAVALVYWRASDASSQVPCDHSESPIKLIRLRRGRGQGR